MTGRINEDYEAVVGIAVRSSDLAVTVAAVVDTGFSEFLMLPTSLLSGLGAIVEDESRVTLGDGSIVLLDVYVVEIEWFGRWRLVKTLASEGNALIGMKLLEGYDLSMRIMPGGEVRVVPV